MPRFENWVYRFWFADSGKEICKTRDRGEAYNELQKIMYASIRAGAEMPDIHYYECEEAARLYQEIKKGERVMRWVYEGNKKAETA